MSIGKRFSALVAIFAIFAIFANVPGTEAAAKIACGRGPEALAVVGYVEAGGSVEFFDSPESIFAKMLAGEIVAAITPSPFAAFASSRSEGDLFVAATVERNRYRISARTDSEDADPVGASGKNDVPEILRYESDSGTELKFVFFSSYAELSKALGSGRTKKALLPEPYAGTAGPGNGETDVSAAFEEKYGFPIPSMCLLVSSKAETETLFEALRKSIAYAREHPESAAGKLKTRGIYAFPASPKNYAATLVFDDSDEEKENLKRFFGIAEEVFPSMLGGYGEKISYRPKPGNTGFAVPEGFIIKKK